MARGVVRAVGQGANEEYSHRYVKSEQRRPATRRFLAQGLPFFGSRVSLLVGHRAAAMLPPRASPESQIPGNATLPIYLNRPQVAAAVPAAVKFHPPQLLLAPNK